MTSEEILAKLRIWLAAGGSMPWLAAHLGYRSETTIRKWIERQRVPHWKIAAIAAALKESRK